MRYQDLILAGKARLELARLECADPLFHMKQIVEAATGIDSAQLISRWDAQVEEPDQGKVEAFLLRRLAGEPFQYIAGYEWFWKQKFAVGPGVLIPRPETELLVELALDRLPTSALTVAELGAGTGILGISLLNERPWIWNAWEANAESVPFARRNLALLPPGAEYHLFEGDFFEGVQAWEPADWWIANPPYVTRAEIPRLSREVRHEPARALDGGETGVEIVARLIEMAPKHVKPGGGVLLEIGSDQGPTVLRLLQKAGLWDARIEKDLAGKDRVAYGRL